MTDTRSWIVVPSALLGWWVQSGDGRRQWRLTRRTAELTKIGLQNRQRAAYFWRCPEPGCVLPTRHAFAHGDSSGIKWTGSAN